MIKKIVLTLFILFTACCTCFADEIIDSQGKVLPCKIITVLDGLIEYKINGNRVSFEREFNSPVFNDYVDVRTNFFARYDNSKRYFGKIEVKDIWGVRIETQDGNLNIPFFRVKFVGVYKP